MKKKIANNQSINANADGIKGRAHKFYNNICYMFGFYSVVMMLLCKSCFSFVITMGVGIELSVHIGHEINDQYHYPFYLAIYVGLYLFIAIAKIH